MKNSFRLEIALYTIVSAVLSVITVVAGAAMVLFIYISMGGKLQFLQNNIEVNGLTYNNPNSMNSNMNSTFTVNELGDGMRNVAGTRMTAEMIGIYCVLFLVTVGLFILYFLKLMKKFSNYMVILEEGMEEISKGNFNHIVGIEGKDEFGLMANKLNQMTVNLQKIIEENQSNENRKHELITSVAHDLRTPLTSVIGYLELLRSDKLDAKTKEHYTQIVYDKAKRLEQLIEDLFSYTKYTYGDVVALSEPMDMIKLIEQLLDEFYPSFEENELSFQFYKDCNKLVSYADGNLLARAFANLIGNAIKYGVEGKRVEIYFAHQNDEMQICVKNYGGIIPDQDLPHIFDRFYRVERSRSQETGGSGLGLAIAQSIINAHGGQITARSSLNGTVFEVKLPVIHEPQRS